MTNFLFTKDTASPTVQSFHFSVLLKKAVLLFSTLLLFSNLYAFEGRDTIPSTITAFDEEISIPYCEETLFTCYSFEVCNFCDELNPDDVSFNGNGSGLNSISVIVDTAGSCTAFEVCGDVAVGNYTFTIVYDAQVVQTSFDANQIDNQPPIITFPDTLDFIIPICESSVMSTIYIAVTDDCDIINTNDVEVSLDGVSLNASGYLEYTLDLTIENDGNILSASYTDSEGVLTTETMAIGVVAEPDLTSPEISPMSDMAVGVYLCDDILGEVCFGVLVTDNCDENLLPMISIDGVVMDVAPIGDTYCVALSEGNYSVIIEIMDAANNASSESFNITVTEVDEPEVDLICLATVELTIIENCQVELTASDVLTGEWACLTNENFTITVEDDDPSNGAIIDGLGLFVYTVEVNAGVDAGGFTTCTGEVNTESTTTLNMTCPPADSLIFQTGPFSCTAYFIIPTPIISNACEAYELSADFYRYQWIPLEWQSPYWGEVLIFSGIPGEYATDIWERDGGFIRYQAITASGDTTIIDCPFDVQDQVTPIAVCDEDLTVSIGGSGFARVYAEDIDEGSNDNCGEVRTEVRRTDGAWGDYVDLSCEDVGQYVTIELRVWDDANTDGIIGNDGDLSAICGLEILIEDKINPFCYSPADVSTTCNEVELNAIDWNDTNQLNELFGTPAATDNCNANLLVEQISVNVNTSDCGWGTVVRTFQATDTWGLTSLNTCEQVITIYENDLTLAVTSTSTVFDENIACESMVEVTFTVSTFCTVGMLTLQGSVDINTDEIFDGDAIITYISANETLNTYTISGNYPTGNHSFYLTVEDGCSNMVELDIPFEVIDSYAPAPICIAGLTVTIMPQPDGCCAQMVWATDLLNGLETDCSGDITYSLHKWTEVESGEDIPNQNQAGVVLDCNDAATTQLYIYAWDNANNPYAVQPDGTVGGANYDYCITYILIQSHVACSGYEGLAGVVQTEENAGVEGVMLELTGNSFESALTMNDGSYEFSDVVYQNDYTITPHLDELYQSAVTTFDIVLITKHVLGIELLDSPYKIIAADVNSSQSVTVSDLIQIRKLLLGINNDFPDNTFWRFVDADYVFPVPTNPWTEAFPEARNIININQNELTNDFIGIAIGDVNGSVVPNVVDDFEERNAVGLFTLTTADIQLKKGAKYSIAFTANDFEYVEGYQFTLAFDEMALGFVEIIPGVATAENFGLNYVKEGLIATSWNVFDEKNSSDSELFTLVFQAKIDANLSDLITINSRITKAEAYDNAGLLDIKLNFTNTVEADNVFKVYQNTPNPFSNETIIDFTLPNDELVNITVHDITGKVLYDFTKDGEKGYNSIHLDAQEISAAGVLFYTISTDTFTATNRMVLIK